MTQVQDRTSTVPEAGNGPVERFFKIRERGSSISREIRGGFTTFFAMAYTVLLIPLMLSQATDINGTHLNLAEMTTATALAAGLTTVLMGLIGNVPLALAAGLAVVPVVAYQAAPHMTWPEAMGLVVLMGIIICVISATGLRTLIINAIPLVMKNAIGVGIGMFIAIVGLVSAGVVGHGGASGPPVTLGVEGHLSGWPVVVFAFSLLLMLVLFIRKVPGAILISIIVSTIFAIIINKVFTVPASAWGMAVPKVPSSWVSAPHFGAVGHFNLFGGFSHGSAVTAIVVLFTLVLTGFFDAVGTVFGVCDEAGLVDKDGQMPGMGKVLTMEGAAQVIGGLTGGSGATVYVESATGVGEGSRTGLSSVVTGGLFALAIFLTPIAGVVPIQAAAPALVLVGALMMTQARKIDWSDLEIAIPAFVTIAMMPFTYSITNGVGAGLMAYTIIKVALGKFKEIHWLVWVVSAVFVAYFAVDGIELLFK
ncbi:NCS2 family permease [Nocardia sp. NPDC088792]|uniref:NCS2 family permease n=1 Tax=Nocardia sp. NPDC088792 TaxID=3364332 RepID=UPI00381A6830